MIEVEDLNDDQRKIYEHIMSSIPDKPAKGFKRMSLKPVTEIIKGVAGAGKTTVTALIIRDLINRGYRVFCTAPTHQAASVLNKQYENINPSQSFGMNKPKFVGTIHSALGLILSFNDDKQVLRSTGKARTNIGGVSECDILFADEISMFDKSLKHYLLKQQLEDKFHIIGIGDKDQLDPVSEDGEAKSSPMFELGNEDLHLNQVTRQAADSPIIQMSVLCRENIYHEQGIEGCEKPEGKVMNFIDNEHIFKIHNYHALETYVNFITDEDGLVNPSLALKNRILTFTNKRVNYYNSIIRDYLYQGSTYRGYEPGEIVILQSSVSEKSQNGNFFTNSQEVYIDSVNEVKQELSLPCRFNNAIVTDESYKSFDCFQIRIKNILIDDYVTIYVIKDDQRDEYENWLSEHAKIYKRIKKDNRFGSREGFSQFWDIKNKFTQIKHSFASTIHKAQGSTFDNVILDMEGIKTQMTHSPTMAWKLMYVGCTRPSEKLYLGVG